eukprot:1343041-Alexandrium_andersonii.AAC.1
MEAIYARGKGVPGVKAKDIKPGTWWCSACGLPQWNPSRSCCFRCGELRRKDVGGIAAKPKAKPWEKRDVNEEEQSGKGASSGKGKGQPGGKVKPAFMPKVLRN